MGSLVLGAGMFLLSRLDEFSGFWTTSLAMVVFGVGVGLTMQVLTIIVQGTAEYRDLGVAAATNGRVVAHLVKANMAPEKGTGWHRHEAEFQIVLMTKGWAKFMYGDQETLVEAGDCVHQRPGIVHYLFDYSPDMEYLEIVSPANFKSLDVPAPCEVPTPHSWEIEKAA